MKLESLSVSLHPSPSPGPVTVAVAMMAVQTLVWACIAALTKSISSMVSSRAPARASTLLSSCFDMRFSFLFGTFVGLPGDLRTLSVLIRAALGQVSKRQPEGRRAGAYLVQLFYWKLPGVR